jgi:hypothetical protein
MGFNPTSPLALFSETLKAVLTMCLLRRFLPLVLAVTARGASQELLIDDSIPLNLPAPGAHQLRILTPHVLELTLITAKNPDPAPIQQWNFVSTNGVLSLPPLKEFAVSVDGKKVAIENAGFKRRVLYAPLRQRDLRIANEIYLFLTPAITDNATVEVANSSGRLWPKLMHFRAKADPQRWSPVLHVNQLGYFPAAAKKAMAGYYLGSADELKLDGADNPAPEFSIVEANGGKSIFSGKLKRRQDSGFPFRCYQSVWEADFSEVRAAGEYRLRVPQLGASFPFWIGEGTAALLARTYALGLYHQRCGGENVLPYTRHTHQVCHAAPAAIPLPEKDFANAWEIIAGKTVDAGKNPRHLAPAMTNHATCLYPFVKRGEVDVAGGHHDAGDYSKYTINSAGFIHHLVFAADVFPGVAELDNLGLPESGDGKSDILQEAKWEADFLAKMQDEDGGFYFLVYPREREYESEVLPDRGDRQIVWPKTTAATAAAVAALAQCASSPQFKKQFPAAAAAYLDKAKKGWAFLEKAIARYGNDGSYQKITHYGDEFIHDDELAWAACEMFIATRDQSIHAKLRRMFNPNDAGIRKWSWWRLYEAYGCATRSYAFAAKAGKLAKTDLDLSFLTKCENEVSAAGEDQSKRADNCAYGTSFPKETKRVRSAGWYFSCDPAFDLAVAYQLDYPVRNDPRPRFMEAILSNFNYQLGCNPVNVCYLTGLGQRRQREIVHQYALNDGRILPPAGIPIGDVQSSFGWLDLYQRELGAISYPLDGDQQAPYPMYDRWGDSFNLSTEFVILEQARGLATAAFLMAQTSLKSQPWKPAVASITPAAQKSAGNPQAFRLSSDHQPMESRIIWEANGEQLNAGSPFMLQNSATQTWIEAEAVLPDGWFVFARTNRQGPSASIAAQRLKH